MIYLGARIDGDTYGRSGDAPWDATTWNLFEEHIGRKVNIVHWGQPFCKLDQSALKSVSARGAVTLLSMDTFSTTLASIVEKKQDAAIDAFAKSCALWGGPLLLRFDWEMNGTWYPWSKEGAQTYVKAWRYFHDRVKPVAPNVSWVWCPNTIYSTASEIAPWYPGNAYVDWVGVDGYNRGTNPYKPDRWKTPVEVFSSTYKRLGEVAPGKPIIICETASTEYGGSKATWITELFKALPTSFPRVRALVWFNWNIVEGGGRMDWPIESSPKAQEAFRAAVASSSIAPAAFTDLVVL